MATTTESTFGETTAPLPTTVDETTSPVTTSGPDDTTMSMPTTGTDDTTTFTTGPGVCGDGVPDPGEPCDDGNQVDNDACTNACELAKCGDGVVQGSEACDDSGESASCDDDCTPVSCGDGKLNAAAGETCEPAYVVDDTCTPACERVRIFDAGLQHICMVDLDDTLHCWGSGVHGQLGQGATIDLGTKPGEVPTAPVPFGTGKIVRLSLGTIHTCILLAGGAVRCWGSNTGGQLGNGTLDNIGDGPDELPVEDLVFDPPVVDLAAGAQHTCVLLANGRVRCWGLAIYGRLGYGNLDNLLVPPDVDVPLAEDVVQIVAGGGFTCSLHANHAVRCWGNDTYGQLANGSQKSDFGDNAGEIFPDEVPVSSADDPVQRLAVGYEFTCALLQSGNIRCWGRGGSGRLGTGSTGNVGNEDPVMMTNVNLGGPAVQVAAGFDHACARMATGAVKCWGANPETGVPNGQDIDMPNEFPPPDLKVGGEVRRVITHMGDFSCALLVDDKLRCWGNNDVGQLGYGVQAPIGDNEHPDAAGPVPF